MADLFVLGGLCGIPVVMACVYAPTRDDDKFILIFLFSLPNIDDHHLIIGGEFGELNSPQIKLFLSFHVHHSYP